MRPESQDFAIVTSATTNPKRKWKCEMKNRSISCFLVLCLTGCATLDRVVQSSFRKPDVSVTDVRVDKLSFDAITMLFDLKIVNPNPIGITLAGFDYDFSLNDNSVANGNQEQGMAIAGKAESTVQVPVSLDYEDLYETFVSLRYDDHVNYEMDVGLSFDLPVLGQQRLPLRKEGPFPLPKLPKIKVEALQLDRLNITGADLRLRIKCDNPNVFGFTLRGMAYDFDVADKNWLTGTSQPDLTVAAKNDNIIEVPVSLNFFEIGRSAFQLLNGHSDLDYRFKGHLEIEAGLPLIGAVTLPFEQAGRVPLLR